MKNVSNDVGLVPVATGLELKNDAPAEEGAGLERVNVMLDARSLDWLDTVGNAMYRGTGCRHPGVRSYEASSVPLPRPR
jgi:hypothetical protein